jgi:hypothetical protein
VAIFEFHCFWYGLSSRVFMQIKLRFIPSAILGLSLIAACSVGANPVTVTEVGIGANETVFINSSALGNNLHVYAGVVDLIVDGVATNSFCIDPWHWSANGPQTYNLVSLDLAPKPPGPMGATAALQIEQLWQQYYSPAISNINAAALQIKIWQIVDAAVAGGTFQLNSVDANSAAVYSQLAAMTNFLSSNPNAAAASLAAVTGANGQDYVIQDGRPTSHRVPDEGATFALLAVALAGLVAMRRKF